MQLTHARPLRHAPAFLMQKPEQQVPEKQFQLLKNDNKRPSSLKDRTWQHFERSPHPGIQDRHLNVCKASDVAGHDS
jgi:hypothetical protein